MFKLLAVAILICTFTGPALASAPSTVLDWTMHAYSSCFTTSSGESLDWKVLKAIAYGESGLNTTAGICHKRKTVVEIPSDEIHGTPLVKSKCIKDAKYQGLFQIDSAYCESAFAKFVEKYPEMAKLRMQTHPDYPVNCKEGRVNVDVNILAASFHLTNALDLINQRCPKATLEDKISLLYIRHNDGVGVFRIVLGLNSSPARKAACSYGEINSKLKGYYKTAIANGTSKVKSVDRGMHKIKYGRQRIIPFAKQELGVSSISTKFKVEERKSLCPKDLGYHIFD